MTLTSFAELVRRDLKSRPQAVAAGRLALQHSASSDA
jgi:hypothetical protein